MPRPWIAIAADMRSNAKLTELPNDTARYGWYVALGEAKLHGHKGSLTPGQWKELMGRYARYQRDYVARGLLHLAPDYCSQDSRNRCLRGRGPFAPGTLVVHDWPEHQREHAVRQADYRDRDGPRDSVSDGPSDAQSDAASDSVSDNPSRALSLSLSDVSLPEGGAGGRSPTFDAVELIEGLTSRSFGYTAGSTVWSALEADVGALGYARVAEAYRAVVAAANGAPLDAAGVVYGGHKRLYPIPAAPPSGRDAKRAEHDEVLRKLKHDGSQPGA